MKRIFPITALSGMLFIWVLVPIAKPGEDGSFNVISGLAYCKTRTACIHEVGHALDKRAGWVSQTPEFYQAVQMYLYTELRKEKLERLPANIVEMTYRNRDGHEPIKMELYAYLFEYAKGDPSNMPEIFRPFYDWSLAAWYISRLKEHTTLYYMR